MAFGNEPTASEQGGLRPTFLTNQLASFVAASLTNHIQEHRSDAPCKARRVEIISWPQEKFPAMYCSSNLEEKWKLRKPSCHESAESSKSLLSRIK